MFLQDFFLLKNWLNISLVIENVRMRPYFANASVVLDIADALLVESSEQYFNFDNDYSYSTGLRKWTREAYSEPLAAIECEKGGFSLRIQAKKNFLRLLGMSSST